MARQSKGSVNRNKAKAVNRSAEEYLRALRRPKKAAGGKRSSR